MFHTGPRINTIKTYEKAENVRVSTGVVAIETVGHPMQSTKNNILYVRALYQCQINQLLGTYASIIIITWITCVA